jgi:hypothetical protein
MKSDKLVIGIIIVVVVVGFFLVFKQLKAVNKVIKETTPEVK